jgi:hypothetical protein
MHVAGELYRREGSDDVRAKARTQSGERDQAIPEDRSALLQPRGHELLDATLAGLVAVPSSQILKTSPLEQ